MELYLLSCAAEEEGGGIGKYTLTNGKLEKQAFYPCDRPMYAVKEGNALRVLLRQPTKGSDFGSYFSLDLQLKKGTESQSTEGVCPCHLCVDGKDGYVVNYLSGNLVKIGEKVVAHEGKGVNERRQDMPHTHCAFFSPDKQYVLCCDLGVDTLFCYDRGLNPCSKAKIADGYGIRHAVFSADGKYIYAISEMIPALHVFSFTDGEVRLIKKYDIACEVERADGAAIRVSADGKKLYCSLRVENAILVYEAAGENLRFLQKTACGGDSPRDFNIVGDYLIVTNEKSDNVVVYPLIEGLLGEKKGEISIPKPLCCVAE